MQFNLINIIPSYPNVNVLISQNISRKNTIRIVCLAQIERDRYTKFQVFKFYRSEDIVITRNYFGKDVDTKISLTVCKFLEMPLFGSL